MRTMWCHSFQNVRCATVKMKLLKPRRSSLSIFATLQTVAILIFCPLSEVEADSFYHEKGFCPSEAIVDLTHAIKNASGFLADDESGYSFPPWAIRENSDGVLQGCICDIKPCLPLCPPVKGAKVQVAEDFVNLTAIPRVYNTDMTFDDDEETRGPEERFHFLVWNPCPGKAAYFLEPENYPHDEFHLLENGSLFLPRMNKPGVRFMGLQKYCLRLRPNHSSYTPKVCSPEPKPEMKDDFAVAKYVGGLIAVPFLVATVIVYSVLPELRNIHGTALRCYLCCLIVTFVALAADRIPPPDLSAGVVCLCLGFTIYASFLASFFWLNVMCFEMWRRFRGSGSAQENGARRDHKRFVGYSIYAWGLTVILTSFCISMEFSGAVQYFLIRPGFRFKACWFSTKLAEALYFYGPLSLIIVCNIFLFISTSIDILRYKNRTESSKRNDKHMEWFGLLLKLFVIMGISWSTEIISWLWEGPKYLWYFTDTLNALQGVLIFVIFVCKKSIWRSLKNRFSKKKPLDVDFQTYDFQTYDCASVSPNDFLLDSQKTVIIDERKDSVP